MKFLKVLLVSCICFCLGFFAVWTIQNIPWQGSISLSLRQFYNLKKAEAVNSSEIEVYMDDALLVSDTSLKHLYVSEQLDLMISAQALTKNMKITVAALENDFYELSHIQNFVGAVREADESHLQAKDSNRFVIDSGCTAVKNAMVFVSLSEVCSAFGYDYVFDVDQGEARLTSPIIVTEAESGFGAYDGAGNGLSSGSDGAGNGLSSGSDDASDNGLASESDVADNDLPSSYDMRMDGRAPGVGSQGDFGTCWAFAAAAALESTLLPEERLSFSVDHMSLNNGFMDNQNAGGDYYVALSYLTSWKGPVRAADDPYGDGVTNTSLMPVKHLQEAVIIESKDYTSIKQMIYRFGAVQSSFYSDIEYSNVASEYYNIDTAAYYYPGDEPANHDIVIVGWDDDYPKENFNFKPENDGAFLCQNSWGNVFGKEGYFYISYEDTNIGCYNIVYTGLDSVDNYAKIYQSDQLGWIGSIGYNGPEAWFANVYTASEPETMEAVSFYATGKNTYYEVYLVPKYVTQDSLKEAVFSCSGLIENTGYYTVPLQENMSVLGPFAVIVYMETPDAIHPVAIEYASEEAGVTVDLSDGQGYISSNGRFWQRAEDTYQCNVCLKVFTNN